MNNKRAELTPIAFLISFLIIIVLGIVVITYTADTAEDIDVVEVARFIITVSEGAYGQAKVAQSKQEYFNCGKQLGIYLDTLLI